MITDDEIEKALEQELASYSAFMGNRGYDLPKAEASTWRDGFESGARWVLSQESKCDACGGEMVWPVMCEKCEAGIAELEEKG
jgi:hypothetical protein